MASIKEILKWHLWQNAVVPVAFSEIPEKDNIEQAAIITVPSGLLCCGVGSPHSTADCRIMESYP